MPSFVVDGEAVTTADRLPVLPLRDVGASSNKGAVPFNTDDSVIFTSTTSSRVGRSDRKSTRLNSSHG